MRRLSNSDEGGVVAIFVLFMVVGLLGVTGLVVDFGIVRAEKRELQNGADAAALALAQDCALSLLCINYPKAQSYARANATDNAAGVTNVSQPSSASVRVDTRTLTTGGDASFATKFAHYIGGPTSAFATATATAGWGAPSSALTIPLTISLCEWNFLTNLGTNFGASHTIYFHSPTANQNQVPACPPSPANQNLPGGFGWLDIVAGSGCRTALLTSNNLAGSAPGNSPPGQNTGCTPAMFLNTPILIPVFDQVSQSGQNGQYRIVGFATFTMTRMQLGACGQVCWSPNPPPPNCSSSERCIYGSFSKALTPPSGGPGGGGPNLGTLSVFLTE